MDFQIQRIDFRFSQDALTWLDVTGLNVNAQEIITMSKTRIHVETPITAKSQIKLNGTRAQYVGRVLRLKINDDLTLFDGSGAEFLGTVKAINKSNAEIIVSRRIEKSVESPLRMHLLQGISRGERMNLVIQKATELGVNQITPIITDHSVVRLELRRAKKRLIHWRRIAISACEQCGRNVVPRINAPVGLQEWIDNNGNEHDMRLILNPRASTSISSITAVESNLTLLIGPEGGFSDPEYLLTSSNGFKSIRFGPRIMRTETAAIAIISALQALHGDLN